MSSSISLQADLGTLGVAGLGAFTQVLTAITADNVAPMALIQVEQLGGLFLCSGKFYKRMPDLLRQSSSYRMERLGLMVGWRKNDAPSYLANTAGGQSIALLIACLQNLGSGSQVGEICHTLSEVSKCIFAKVNSVGFTHHLADTVTRIRQVYLNLQKNAPPQLLEGPSDDGLVDFLDGMSRALRDSDTLLRVTGISGMATIASLALLICPEDTTLSVEQIVIHQGSRLSVLIEIEGADNLLPFASDVVTTFDLETVLSGSNRIHTINVETRDLHYPIKSRSKHYTYLWDSWLLDTAKLRFMEHGFVFPESGAMLIASMIACLHYSIDVFPERSENGDKLIGLTAAALLGPDASARLSVFCKETLGAEPFHQRRSIEELAKALVDECSLEHEHFVSHESWGRWAYDWRKSQLMYDLASLILDGFVAVFINPGRGVTMTSRRKPYKKPRGPDSPAEEARYVSPTTDQLASDLCAEVCRLESSEGGHRLLSMIYGLLQTDGPIWVDTVQHRKEELPYPRCYENFGQGSDCCVLYPAILDDMTISPHTGLVLRLEPGHFLFQGRRYQNLRAQSLGKFYDAKPANSLSWPLKASNIGKHSDSTLTVHERHNTIEFRLTVMTDGMQEKLNIPSLVTGACIIETLAPCEHRRDDPLSAMDAAQDDVGTPVRIVGVEMYWKTRSPDPWNPQDLRRSSTVAFALTKGNAEAQLFTLAMFACGPFAGRQDGGSSNYWRYFMQGDCCMKCALERLRDTYHSSLIILT
ncbi:MAG: hypothetical protein Q9187_005911 [Circinaria calcarea]